MLLTDLHLLCFFWHSRSCLHLDFSLGCLPRCSALCLSFAHFHWLILLVLRFFFFKLLCVIIVIVIVVIVIIVIIVIVIIYFLLWCLFPHFLPFLPRFSFLFVRRLGCVEGSIALSSCILFGDLYVSRLREGARDMRFLDRLWSRGHGSSCALTWCVIGLFCLKLFCGHAWNGRHSWRGKCWGHSRLVLRRF